MADPGDPGASKREDETQAASQARDTDGPRATTLRFQGAANRVVRILMHTPLLCRVVGRRLVVIHVVGRQSGTRYDVPVAYEADGSTLLVGSPFAWGRNLRTGEPVEILLKGKRMSAEVEVLRDEDEVVAEYGRMARANRQFASFNKIRLDDHGEPDIDDLRASWRAGARAFRLTPLG